MKNDSLKSELLDDGLVPQEKEEFANSKYSPSEYLKIIGFTIVCFYLLKSTARGIVEFPSWLYSSKNKFLLIFFPLIISLSGILFLMLINILRGNYFKLKWKFWVIGFTLSYYIYLLMFYFP